MVLSNFTGGLNTKETPSFIQPTESVINQNIDDTEICIQPLKSNIATAQNFGSNGAFVYFNGDWVSGPTYTKFIEFNQSLFYVNSSGELVKRGQDGLDKTVGLDAPTTPLTVATTNEVTVSIDNATETEFNNYINEAPLPLDSNDSPIVPTEDDLPTNTYQYLVVYYSNIDNYSIYKENFYYESETNMYGISIDISAPSAIELVEVYRLYNGVYRLLKSGTGTFTVLDAVLDISSNTSFNLTYFTEAVGTRQYCYTYYRISDGTESAPSPFSSEVDNNTNTMQISGFVEPIDTSVTHYKIYRIGGSISKMSLVDTIAVGQVSYEDTVSDLTVSSNGQLDTYDIIKPPLNMVCLTEHNSVLYGIVGNTLWFSRVGTVDMWEAYNYITMSEELIALGSAANGLLLFNKNKTHILTGNNNLTHVLSVLDKAQGCIASVAVDHYRGSVIWLSLDGICVSNGGLVEVITLTKLGKLSLNPICTMVYDNQFYLFHSTGTLIVDFKRGVVFKTMDLLVNGAYYSSHFDKAYFINPNDNGMYELGTSYTNLTYRYKTGRLSSRGLTGMQIFKTIFIYCEGSDCTLTVHVNNSTSFTRTLVDGLNEIKFPSSIVRAYFIELEFVGTSKIIEIELKTEGRQNGN